MNKDYKNGVITGLVTGFIIGILFATLVQVANYSEEVKSLAKSETQISMQQASIIQLKKELRLCRGL